MEKKWRKMYFWKILRLCLMLEITKERQKNVYVFNYNYIYIYIYIMFFQLWNQIWEINFS